MTVLRGLALRAVALAALWWVLVEGDPGSLSYAAAAVPLAVAASWWLAPPRRQPRPDRRQSSRRGEPGRARAVVSLAGWYLVQIVHGGIDVARRILRRQLDVAPILVEVRTSLPAGPLRPLAVGMYNLMPGSLVAWTDGRTVRLHSLAADMAPEEQWRDLERRLAAAAGTGLAPAD